MVDRHCGEKTQRIVYVHGHQMSLADSRSISELAILAPPEIRLEPACNSLYACRRKRGGEEEIQGKRLHNPFGRSVCCVGVSTFV